VRRRYGLKERMLGCAIGKAMGLGEGGGEALRRWDEGMGGFLGDEVKKVVEGRRIVSCEVCDGWLLMVRRDRRVEVGLV
jgi:hypothetical protein